MASAPFAFSRHEILERLRLIRTETVGPISFRQLLRQYGTVDAALAALPSLARRGGRKGQLRIPSRAEAERELSALEALGGKMIAQDTPDYPGNLAAIPDAPPLLSVIGNLHLLHQRVIAIVGARNASLAGCRIAFNLAQELAQAGIIIISGLARGVDTHAHKGSIEGGTIAVMAGGVDIPYPESNTDLYKEIAQRGALISEIPFGIHPQASHFPRRNRLIAGMALGVAVIEAAAKSGSLITARLAADYGREVFAVPGSPLDPRNRGCNDLLRQGATILESAEDVLQSLASQESSRILERKRHDFMEIPLDTPSEQVLEKARIKVIEALGPTPTEVDTIIRHCLLSTPVVLTVLLELELAGRLERHFGGRVSLLN